MKIKLTKIQILLFGFVTLLQSCSSSYRVASKNNAKKIYNLKYGEHKRNLMDVFLPANYSPNAPLVMVVHGGGWVMGSKEHMYNVRNYLFENNIPSVSINYRWVKSGITYKQQLEDLDKAVKFTLKNSEKWNLQKDKIIILGESSGGHLSLLYGYKNPEKIEKIISMSGPADLYSVNYHRNPYYKRSHKIFELVVGAKYNEQNFEKFKEASPIAQVKNVPTLIFQGDKDYLVDESQGATLDSVLTSKGYQHQFFQMKNQGHIPRVIKPKYARETIFPEILKFIKD